MSKQTEAIWNEAVARFTFAFGQAPIFTDANDTILFAELFEDVLRTRIAADVSDFIEKPFERRKRGKKV